jgi:hypothetical protein
MVFVRFGLIVTGRGEAGFLPRLFRPITAAASCTFVVIRKSEQLSPITSERRQIRMVGRGQVIPPVDEAQYGIPARIFLQRHPDSFVVVVDDLEGPRKGRVTAVFNRYRRALDQMLDPFGLAGRASVHFLVNMLEAYYFAHAAAVNGAAGREILNQDHPADVETIGHPKNLLKRLWGEFDEVAHGPAVLDGLDLHHVLHDPLQCCWLRTLFHWCVSRLPSESVINDQVYQWFRLPDGCREPLTENQQVVEGSGQ